MSLKTMDFKAETKKLLHLVTHSLYSNRDVFLRELVSNASDALDKARFAALTDPKAFADDLDWKIEIIPDRELKTLTISDNGIGMNAEEVEKYLGSIALSGTQSFLEAMKQSKDTQNPGELIGQFGVGFYSAFMVSNRVSVITRKAGELKGIQWESHGEETFSIELLEKQRRGTDVILYLQEECYEYLEEWKIKELIKQYSNYIEFPILMDIEREEVEKDADGKPKQGTKPQKKIERQTLNDQQALWLKAPKDVTEEDYKTFYQHLSNDFNKPLTHIHYRVEGTTEFTALLYIPSLKPFHFLNQENIKNNIHLYVKRVFILKNSEALIPEYLRFVSGVVDSSDLPLNVSREILQSNKIVKIIRNSITTKILKALSSFKSQHKAEYKDFFESFGRILKEGVYTDKENQEILLELLIYRSTQTTGDEYISFDEYIARMSSEQKAIYFLPGESQQDVENLSHLEIFQDKGYEVLYFTDPIDEIMMQMVSEYKGHKFHSILKGELDIIPPQDKKSTEEDYKAFTDCMQKHLEQHIKEVRISHRLTSSVCCLVNDAQGMSIHMEKLMKAYNQNLPETKRIMEINPEHQLIQKMRELFQNQGSSDHLKEYIELLYDQALIMEGSKIPSPKKFTDRFSRLLLVNF